MHSLLDFGIFPKPTTDERLRLDTRVLLKKPRRLCRPNGEQAAQKHEDTGVLTWNSRSTGERLGRVEFGWTKGKTMGAFVVAYCQDGEAHVEAVRLVTTSIESRGRRWWALCPLCERRVAVLYSGPPFACWRCHGLAYASARQTSMARQRRRWTRQSRSRRFQINLAAASRFPTLA